MQITKGKSEAARRVLPMVLQVSEALNARWKAQGEPTDGWLFPSGSSRGRLEGSTAKGFHARALKKANQDLDESKLPELKRF
jgi:hypothetical protein